MTITRMPRALWLAAAAAALAGCSATPPRLTPTPTAGPPPGSGATAAPVRPAAPTAAAGASGLIGATANAIAASFGPARLDVREGPGRKMQFAGPQCVLDIYFFPQPGGREAVVSHVDARDDEGRDVDISRCTAALRRR